MMAKRRQTHNSKVKQLAQAVNKLSLNQKRQLQIILQQLITSSAPLPALFEEILQLGSSEQQEMLHIIQGLMEAEEEQEEPQPTAQTKGRGSFEYKMITKKNTGTKCGPYKYLRYWVIENGARKHKSIYIEKADSNINKD